jgi:hypothetical protein
VGERDAGHRDQVAPDLPGYRIDRELRRGAAAVKYQARELSGDTGVTLTVLGGALTGDGPARRRFLREARTLAGIEHPHLLPVHEVRGDDAAATYVAVRRVEGTDLATLVNTAGPLDLERCVRLVGQLAGALDAAHEEGLVHRGLRAEHVLVEDRGDAGEHCYLSGFGLGDGLAPEQIEGDPVDARGDVYALGCVLYQCLTGAAPFAGADPDTVRRRHLDEAPPRIAADRPELPAALDTVLVTAMAKKPEQRYATAGRLAEALRVLPTRSAEEAAPTQPGAVGPGDPTGPLRTPPAVPPEPPPARRRHRGLLLATAAAVVVLAAVAGFLVFRSGFPNEQEAALLAVVPTAFRDTCSAGAGGVTSVRCTPDQGAADLLIEQFDSPDTLAGGYESAVRRAQVTTDTGNCAMGTGGEQAYAGQRAGRVVCFTDATTATVVWTDEERRTLATATAPAAEAGAMAAWWSGLVGLPPPPPFPTADEQALLDQLLEEDCERAADLAVHPGATAGVRCAALTGEAEAVRYYQFGDEAALQAVFAETVRAVGAQDIDGVSCADSPPGFLSLDPWSVGGVPVGRLVCHTAADGRAVMEWTHDGLRLLGVVEGADPAAVNRYWFRTIAVFPAVTDADPFPTAQEQALLDHVPVAVRLTCIRYTSPPGLLRSPSEVAGVACEPAGGQLRVIYKSYSDLEGMAFDFDFIAGVLKAPAGVDCTTAPEPFLGVGDYTVSGERAGRLMCFPLEGGTPSIAWTNEELLITAEAVGADPTMLLDFWRSQAGPWPPA